MLIKEQVIDCVSIPEREESHAELSGVPGCATSAPSLQTWRNTFKNFTREETPTKFHTWRNTFKNFMRLQTQREGGNGGVAEHVVVGKAISEAE